MPTTDYRRALDAVTKEYEALLKQRADIDLRLAQLGHTMGSLMRLCDIRPVMALGLTDAVRMVLRAAGHPLTAIEVRGQLEAMGFDLDRYTNDLAAIHTILKRLNESGETNFVARAYAKPAYQLKPHSQVQSIAITESDARKIGLRRSTRRPRRNAEDK